MAELRQKCCLRHRKSDMMGYIQIPGNLVYLAFLFVLFTNSRRCHMHKEIQNLVVYISMDFEFLVLDRGESEETYMLKL